MFRLADANLLFTPVVGLLFRGWKVLRLMTRYMPCLLLALNCCHLTPCSSYLFQSFSYGYASFLKLDQYVFYCDHHKLPPLWPWILLLKLLHYMSLFQSLAFLEDSILHVLSWRVKFIDLLCSYYVFRSIVQLQKRECSLLFFIDWLIWKFTWS